MSRPTAPGSVGRVSGAVRRRAARVVPSRGDRWTPLEADLVVDGRADGRADGSGTGAAPRLHAPPALATSVDRFVAHALRGTDADPAATTAPEGLLELSSVRCDVGNEAAAAAADPSDPRIRVGALRGRRGRPLRGPSALLDLPRPSRPRGAVRTLVLDGPVVVLDLRARSAENFFHLHVDALANRWLVERLRPDVLARPGLRWLVPEGPAAWRAEALALAGLAGDALVPLAEVDRVVAPSVLVPARGLGSRHVPSWAVAALRAVGGGAHEASGAAPAPARLLHVSRGDAARRRLVGEERLRAGLAARGFATVTLSGMSVAEQRRRFAAADVIVAEHGAALTNLAWAGPGADVVELLPVARPNLAYRRIALQAGLGHVGVLCAPAEGSGEAAAPHGDMVVDTELALRVVDEVLSARGGR